MLVCVVVGDEDGVCLECRGDEADAGAACDAAAGVDVPVGDF